MTGVRTAGGPDVRLPAVLVAAGAWSAQGRAGDRALRRRCVREGPAAGAPRAPWATGSRHALMIRTPRCYVVTRADGRVVIGATTEELGFDTAVTADGVFRLLEAATRCCPRWGSSS